MAHKWSEKEIGALKLGKDATKTLVPPGGQIPDELITPELLERFEGKIIEYEVVREVPKKQKPKKDSK
jgi:hypothetical protein